jgi:hypothetical protein
MTAMTMAGRDRWRCLSAPSSNDWRIELPYRSMESIPYEMGYGPLAGLLIDLAGTDFTSAAELTGET